MAWGHEGSRHDRGYGYEWTKQRKRILARDRYLCQPCLAKGRPTLATEVDHIIAKAFDGTDDDDNLQSICDDCHRAKTKREANEARGIKGRPVFDKDGWPVW